MWCERVSGVEGQQFESEWIVCGKELMIGRREKASDKPEKYRFDFEYPERFFTFPMGDFEEDKFTSRLDFS